MSASYSITPWVGRLIAINAVVLLLQQSTFRRRRCSTW